jgi:hypothetical protein
MPSTAMEASMLTPNVTVSLAATRSARAQPIPLVAATAGHTPDRPQFHQLPRPTQAAIAGMLDEGDPIPGLDDPDTVPDWSEQSIVELHWVLLRQLNNLSDPQTPLEEKLDTLAWALTDPRNDDRPFSFANCLRVVGTSPLSPTAYFGKLSVEEVRDWLRINARRWLRETVALYPQWVQRLILDQPDLAAKELSANPQWINEQIKKRLASRQCDLFEGPVGLLN